MNVRCYKSQFTVGLRTRLYLDNTITVLLKSQEPNVFPTVKQSEYS